MTLIQEAFRLERSTDRDVVFVGYVLGRGTLQHGPNGERNLAIDIYRTVSGAYVVHVGTDAPDGPPRRMVTVFDDPAALLKGLFHKGKMGYASRQAWHEACLNDERLAALETESIE